MSLPANFPLAIDGAQYSNWSEAIFRQMRDGGLAAVNVTLVYWETARETLTNFGRWNVLFERHRDLIAPIGRMADIAQIRASGRVGIMFGLQNCSPIDDDVALVEIMRQLGVRTMQLTYNNQTSLASGCYESTDNGLTRFGKVVVREMNRVGMLVDMSHSAERSTFEAIDASAQPIVISHANPLRFHDSRRNKSDALLKALAARGGLVGLSTYPFHLPNGPDCTLAEFTAMAADLADMIGVEHIGIGSDLCQDQPYSVLEWMRNGRWSRETDFGEGSQANAGWPAQPAWFRTSADFPVVYQGLLERGFSPDDAALIMGGNWYRLLADAEQAFGRRHGAQS